MSSMLDTLNSYRTLATPTQFVDTIGLSDRDPALLDVGRAEVSYEAQPFAKLVADIDLFFEGDLEEALTGPRAAEAESHARRIIAEHLRAANSRLSMSSTATDKVDWADATGETLQRLAGVALRRAGDLRFVQVVTPAVGAVTQTR